MERRQKLISVIASVQTVLKNIIRIWTFMVMIKVTLQLKMIGSPERYRSGHFIFTSALLKFCLEWYGYIFIIDK